MFIPNSPAGTSHVGQALDFNACCVTFSIWSAIQADKIGKQLRTLQSAKINWDGINRRVLQGAKMNPNTSCSVSAFTCLWY